MKSLRIGSRGSPLARWQAEHIQGLLKQCSPGIESEIRIIKTTGDRLQTESIRKIGGKGIFVKEIEEALLVGRIDLAVHSLKDMPTEQPPGLTLAMIPKREDPRDALICDSRIASWQELPQGARIGTGSMRRRLLLKALRPDLEMVDIRGNVDTRLRKLTSHDIQGIVLAAAGLRRLQKESHISQLFSLREMIPAVAQGALCVETRDEDHETRELLAPLEDADTRACVEAERAFLRALGGGCQVPMGAHAWLSPTQANFTAFVAGIQSAEVLRTDQRGSRTSLSELVEKGLADLMGRGGQRLLSEQEP